MTNSRSELTEERCPLCKSRLLSEGRTKWCSFLGTTNYLACTYGIDKEVLVDVPLNK